MPGLSPRLHTFVAIDCHTFSKFCLLHMPLVPPPSSVLRTLPPHCRCLMSAGSAVFLFNPLERRITRSACRLFFVFFHTPPDYLCSRLKFSPLPASFFRYLSSVTYGRPGLRPFLFPFFLDPPIHVDTRRFPPWETHPPSDLLRSFPSLNPPTCPIP